LKRSLAAGPAAAYFTGKKVEELGPLLPSKKLVLATAACFLALSALSAALLLCVVLTGEAPPELVSAIVSLASTLAGIYMGRRW